MLLQLRIENFRSFRDTEELSFVASGLDERIGVASSHVAPKGALRLLALYGANASGKTNVILALSFIQHAVAASHRAWKPDQGVPRRPFAFPSDQAARDSTFEIDAELDGIRYQYTFSLNDERITQERLAAYPSGHRQVWFSRDLDGFTFGKKLRGENRLIEKVTRPNSLFLSAAAQNNHEQLTPLHSWISRWRFVHGDRQSLFRKTAEFCRGDRGRPLIEQLLKSADLGIVGFEAREVETDEAFRKIFEAVKSAFPELSDSRALEMPKTVTEIAFLHAMAGDSPRPLAPTQESDGTVALFALLGPVVEALEVGGILCVDELDSSLHPLLALEIVRLFNDPERNPKNAQLVFNTHDTNLLNSRYLRRDQIWLVEKDTDGASHIYPLTDFKIRRGDNIRTGYLLGRYGAVPAIGDFDPDVEQVGSGR